MVDINDSWYRISIKAIIKNKNGKVLLAYKDGNGLWGMPGGGLEHGETIKKCLNREIKEEMGLVILKIKNEPTCFITSNKGFNELMPWIGNLCYEIEVENLNFTLSDECNKIGFFNLDDLKEIKVFENVEKIFKEIF